MTKAGNRRLRRMLYLAADTARKEDPQLARIYWVQMVERGANHTKALAVVAAHLARQSAYVVRDTDGNAVSRAEAKHIIAERWTVDEETRRRRRSKKRAGKAPQQVLKGHAQNGARSASTRRPSPATIVDREALVRSTEDSP